MNVRRSVGERDEARALRHRLDYKTTTAAAVAANASSPSLYSLCGSLHHLQRHLRTIDLCMLI